MDFTGSDPKVRYATNFTTGTRPHPFVRERNPELVAEEVRDGVLTGGQARSRYGVVLDGTRAVDLPATASARTALAAAMMNAPPQLRSIVLEALREELNRRDGPIVDADVHAAARSLGL